MVRSISILIAAALVAAPALAAPSLPRDALEFEAREPRFRLSPGTIDKLKNFGHIFHKGAHGAKSTAEMALTVNSMIPQTQKREFDRLELEEREPRISPARLRQAAHVGHQVAHDGKGTIETASAIHGMVRSRELNDELVEREPSVSKAQVRQSAHVARKAGSGALGLFGTAAAIHSMIPQKQRRNLEEIDLFEREPRITKARMRQSAHVGHKVGSAAKSMMETAAAIHSMLAPKRRDFDEDLDAREFDEGILAREWYTEYDDLD